jgi:hypothetical protein
MLYALVQYGFLTVICIYLVNQYASKEVSISVKVWSVITWVLNFGLALLVPQDVFMTLRGHQEPMEIRSLGLQYLVLYWIVYLLTWTVIPVLQEWEDSGDIESDARLRRSLRTNGIFYLYLLAISIVCLIGIMLLGAAEEMGLILFLKCLATMWGMFLLMVLLGYSLVEIPKTMWKNARP